MLYLDTSILVAYYVPEPLSQPVQTRLMAALSITVSELAQTEFFSALLLRVRIGDLTHRDAQTIATLFLGHLQDNLYGPLHLTSDVYLLARDYIARFELPLKAPDALHLAAAGLAQLPLLTADRQLARNAEILGIACELIEVA